MSSLLVVLLITPASVYSQDRATSPGASAETVPALPVATRPATTAPAAAQNSASIDDPSSARVRAPDTAPATAPDAATSPRQQRLARTTRPTTARAVPYTAPGAAFRGTGTAVGRAAAIQIALTPAVTGGRERAEALAAQPFAGTIGTTSVTPPTSQFGAATVTTPGILRSQLVGLGFASQNNLLTARPNPATGPGGVCNQLTGFRPGPAICGMQRR